MGRKELEDSLEDDLGKCLLGCYYYATDILKRSIAEAMGKPYERKKEDEEKEGTYIQFFLKRYPEQHKASP